MPVRTLIFDLGRTLIDFSLNRLEPEIHACREQAQRYFLQAETGALPAAELQAAICGLTGMAPMRFAPWWNSIFASGWLIPPEWILSLKSRYRVGLLSNTNQTHFEHLAQTRPLLQAFDFHVLSHEVGAAKPDDRIYAAAEGQAQCPPEAIFYVDDVAGFVEAARRRGWCATQFSGIKALADALAAAGVHLADELRAKAGVSRTNTSVPTEGS